MRMPAEPKILQCTVCSKQTDAGAFEYYWPLCGTHLDAWLLSCERQRALADGTPASWLRNFSDFVYRLQAERRNGRS